MRGAILYNSDFSTNTNTYMINKFQILSDQRYEKQLNLI